MFCENCGNPSKSFCKNCGAPREEYKASAPTSSTPPRKIDETKKERLLVEMRKELGKAKIKAARANGADPPYHWHHTLQRAIDSLVAYEGPVESPQDLVGIPHFGKFVRSLATTCWHHARLADPTNSSRPKRHRDGTPTPARRAYHPHYRGFAFATLYYFRRRFNARSVPELISVDEKHRVAAAPIIVTKKGWQGSPLADLAQRGLVTGNASAGWSLTPAGEEVADACCARWDEGEQEPKRQRQSMGLGDDDTEAAEPEADPDAADSDKPQQRQQRSRQPAKPSGPVSAFASDFYDVGSQDEDEIVILDRTHRSSSSASAASSSASSPHASSPSSASSAGPSPAAPAGPSAAGPSPALSGKDEKA